MITPRAPRNRKPNPLKESYEEVSPGVMFKEEKL